jgi:hypothetical protein
MYRPEAMNMRKLIGLSMFLLLGCDYVDSVLGTRVPLTGEDSAAGTYGLDRKDHPECYSNITIKTGGFCSTGTVCPTWWTQFKCEWTRDSANTSILHITASPSFSTEQVRQQDVAYDLTTTDTSVINADGLEFRRKGP